MTEARHPDDLLAGTGTPFAVRNPKGDAGVVLACEHASPVIPPALGELGLAAEARYSHAVWDIGAVGVARVLADRLGAPLVEARVSRLVIDGNRAPEAPAATPARVEVHEVPGNAGLSAEARAARAAAIHAPFHAALAEVLAARPQAALVTIHSFAPVWFGVARSVQLGFLHGSDATLAEAMLAAAESAGPWWAALNAPYGPADGVMYTIDRHGNAAGRANVMVEIRNDLIAEAAGQSRAAVLLAACLSAAGAIG